MREVEWEWRGGEGETKEDNGGVREACRRRERVGDGGMSSS